MNIYKNCCYECKERYVGCHAKCDKYADYVVKNAKAREERKKVRHGAGVYDYGSRVK